MGKKHTRVREGLARIYTKKGYNYFFSCIGIYISLFNLLLGTIDLLNGGMTGR